LDLTRYQPSRKLELHEHLSAHAQSGVPGFIPAPALNPGTPPVKTKTTISHARREDPPIPSTDEHPKIRSTTRYKPGTIKWYHNKEDRPVAISASEARSRLYPLIQQVNDDHTPVRIASKAGDAVLMSAEDFDSWQETIYLLRSPANARHLMEAVARDKAGTTTVTTTMAELESLAGEG
jgi:antitoxin YefM